MFFIVSKANHKTMRSAPRLENFSIFAAYKNLEKI